MTKRIQTLALLVAAGSLLALPAIGEAAKPAKPGCQKPIVKKGFVVKGTVVTYPAGGALTVTVTKANRHARLAGQTVGSTFVVPASDPFRVQLSEYETGERPGPGDRARIIGKVEVTKKKCATTPASRYGDVDVKKVKFTEVD